MEDSIDMAVVFDEEGRPIDFFLADGRSDAATLTRWRMRLSSVSTNEDSLKSKQVKGAPLRGLTVLHDYYQKHYKGGEDLDIVLADLLADLMHAAEHLSIDWEDAARRADNYYVGDVVETRGL
jgi:hypothetical protein